VTNTHVADHLSAYLDGALPVSDLEQVQAHLEVCGTCGRAYEELRTLRGLLRGLPDPTEPSGLEDRIHWRLAREEASFRASPWRAMWTAVTRPAVTRPLRVALAGATMLIIIGLPMGWVSGLFAPHGTLFDPDAYVRNYLMMSSDRLTDDVTRTVIAHTALPESTVQR
jgi:anti-sigma factor RsiW